MFSVSSFAVVDADVADVAAEVAAVALEGDEVKALGDYTDDDDVGRRFERAAYC